MKLPAFQPPWWLRNAHLQTILPTLMRRFSPSHYVNERLELPDQDFVDLVWTQGAQDSPLVIVLHGLEGSLHSPYIHGVLAAITRQGWRAVLMHFRGCSGELNRLARGYHSGDTADLAFLIHTIRQREPHTVLAAIGYSMGGNVLLKYLGEQSEQTILRTAIAVSVPYELDKIVRHLEHSLGGFYQWWLLRSLQANYRRKFRVDSGPVPLSAVKQLTTLRLFDHHVTAPLHGFNSADDYYQQASSRQYLPYIKIPCLLIHALDDPFMPANILPNAAELPANVQQLTTRYGGHVGFIAGKWPWQMHYWLETVVLAQLRAVFALTISSKPSAV